MEKNYLSLQDAASLLGKSPQTLRRMIKRGEIKAQRMKSPQGFNYMVRIEDMPRTIDALSKLERNSTSQMMFNSPIQNADVPQYKEQESVLPNQAEILTSRNDFEPYLDNDFYTIDKNVEIPNLKMGAELLKIIEQYHTEKMMLFNILGTLQAELEQEKRKPRTFLGCLMDWFFA